MIDEARTLEIFGYMSDELGKWSKKPIAVVCEKCGEPRTCRNDSYRDLCMSCAQAGKKHSIETKAKMRTAQLGEKNHMWGKHLSDERRELLSEMNTGENNPHFGKKRSEKTCRKISASESGKIVTDFTKSKQSEVHKNIPQSNVTRRRRSATMQGISYDEWEEFATTFKYCPKFNEACRESNREKYGRRCFLCGKHESDNLTRSGVQKKLSVHHYDMNKAQGCDGHGWKLVPLCAHHHGSSHSKTWESRITFLLENVWV